MRNNYLITSNLDKSNIVILENAEVKKIKKIRTIDDAFQDIECYTLETKEKGKYNLFFIVAIDFMPTDLVERGKYDFRYNNKSHIKIGEKKYFRIEPTSLVKKIPIKDYMPQNKNTPD
jgi:hypothetical protein